jgi:hypothetical protein
LILCASSCTEQTKHAHLLPKTKGEAARPFPREPIHKENSLIQNAEYLDDLFSLERVIKLETRDSSILGYIQAARFYEHKFYILDNIQNIVQVFDDSGQHLHSIGRNGEGPGEYKKADNIYIVDRRVAVVDSSGTKVLIYDLQGNHIQSITPDTSKFPIYFYGNMIFKEDLLYVCDFFSFDQNMPRHVVLKTSREPAPPVFGFGDRLPFYHTKIGRKTPQYLSNIFTTVDGNIWTIPSYQTDIEVYDFNGHLLGILPSGIDGISKEVVSEIKNPQDYHETRAMTTVVKIFDKY